jgi:hypothetical protein
LLREGADGSDAGATEAPDPTDGWYWCGGTPKYTIIELTTLSGRIRSRSC